MKSASASWGAFPLRAIAANRTCNMCLAIPMQVLEVDGQTARCTAGGVSREVSLFLLPRGSVEPGDFVVVHVGYAIQKIVAHEAQTIWELVDQMEGTDIPERDA
jgi:hydrogenase expression/formation protein HypC